MIDSVLLFKVICDSCGKVFTNEKPVHKPNEFHLYTSREIAEAGIQKVGWIVIENINNMQPRIMCKRCKKISDKLAENY
jgi:hypothetical protein